MAIYECLLLLAVVSSKVICGNGNVQTDRQAEALFQEYWEFTVSSEPEFATSVGDHRFNNKLNSYTLAHYENTKTKLNEFVNRAKQLGSNQGASNSARTNLAVFIQQLQFKLSLLNVKSYLFPVSYLDGPPLTLLQLLDYVPMSKTDDFHNLVSRYRAFPQQVDEVIDLLKEGIRTNMVLHERSVKNFEKTAASFIDEPEKSMFYEPFQKASSFMSPEELKNHLKIAADSISGSLNPAIQKLSDFIKNEYRKHLRSDIAVSSIPDGQEYYRQQLNFYVTADVTPQEIHNLGLKEVERISKEMDKVINSFGENVSMQEFNKRLRSNESMYFSTPEEALNAYTYTIRQLIEPKLPQFFKKLPAAVLEIRQVPEQLAGGPGAYYMPASPDGSTKGTFFLDTSNLKNVPKYQTVTLSLHEAEPGHHLQTSLINEQEGVPMFRKRTQYPMNAAYLEGWALYSEFLGNEMQMYDDKFMLYGHLSEEIFRACRLVVDTGIHALGWSRQQAVDFMVNHSASAEGNIQNEVDRYITWPGQACSYKYGEIKIKEFRSKAENVLGSKFNLKDFHDVVLSSSGPISFVRQQVNSYIHSA